MAPQTTAQLTKTIGEIDARTQELLAAVEALRGRQDAESDRLWTALRGVAGLDGVAAGVSEIAETLAPLRSLAAPSTALGLLPGVGEALDDIGSAVGRQRSTNFNQLATEWDYPVGFIGQVPPVTDYDDLVQEQVP